MRIYPRVTGVLIQGSHRFAFYHSTGKWLAQPLPHRVCVLALVGVGLSHGLQRRVIRDVGSVLMARNHARGMSSQHSRHKPAPCWGELSLAEPAGLSHEL